MSQTETSSPFLPLPEGIVILSVQQEDDLILVHITCRGLSACCPSCHSFSERVHGTYNRTVADLPCAGRRVLLKLLVRKFVCGNPLCAQTIFTERLDRLVLSYARMTNRLSETLQTLGFATCGELGERLTPKLGMQISGPTLLRRMRTRVYTSPSDVPIVGIDDWTCVYAMLYLVLPHLSC